MFLMELGVQAAANVMNRLTPEELGHIAGAITDLELIDPCGADEASREFQCTKANGQAFAKLGSDYALHLVREALRSESRRHSVDVSWRHENLVRIDRSCTREIGIFRG
jgi:flagellar motor switch protein FliG